MTKSREVNIVVKAVRRKEPDLQKLAKALIQLASLDVPSGQTESAPPIEEAS